MSRKRSPEAQRRRDNRQAYRQRQMTKQAYETRAAKRAASSLPAETRQGDPNAHPEHDG